MRKSLGEEYRRQTAEKLCPLKDEPWQQHKWTEGGCGVFRVNERMNKGMNE